MTTYGYYLRENNIISGQVHVCSSFSPSQNTRSLVLIEQRRLVIKINVHTEKK